MNVVTVERSDGTIRTRWPEAGLLLPLVIAAILLGIGNEDFGFDSAGWLDPFMYFGYFWHYPAHLPGIDHDYKASRLPWILIGYVAHALGEPAAASYVLALATLSAGGMAVYVLLRDISRHRAAATVTAAAWTCCTWAHGIGGWNYHMLAATDAFLVATWLVFRAATTGAASSAVLSGICLAAAGHMHLQFASFLPLWVLTYWSGLPWRGPGQIRGAVRGVIRDGVLVLAGAAVLTILLAAINVATGGDWLFFMPQLVRAQYLMHQDVWWAEVRVWVPTATYLIVPIVFMIGSLAVLRRRSEPADRHRPMQVLVLQAWIALAIMCFTQFARRKGTLDQSFLAFPVYAYGFPCIGVALASARDERRSAGVIAVCVAVILGPLLLFMPEPLPHLMNRGAAALGGSGSALILPPLVFALLGAALMLAVRDRARLLMFAVWFGVLNAWIAPAPSAYGIHTPGYRGQMLELFREADGMTAAFDPRLDGIKYYWSTDERLVTSSGEVPLRDVFDSYVSTRGWQGNLLTRDRTVPVLQLTLDDLRTTVCLGVLAPPRTSGELEANLRAHFAALGAPLRRVTTRHLQRRDLSFDLTLLKRADAPERRGPPCLRQ